MVRCSNPFFTAAFRPSVYGRATSIAHLASRAFRVPISNDAIVVPFTSHAAVTASPCSLAGQKGYPERPLAAIIVVITAFPSLETKRRVLSLFGTNYSGRIFNGSATTGSPSFSSLAI